jgi:prevent-host-death family protein
MKKISKSALKARMLEHLRRVEETGEELIVTDRGRPVLRIVPVRERTPAAALFAGLRGKVIYHGDLLEPTAAEWPET